MTNKEVDTKGMLPVVVFIVAIVILIPILKAISKTISGIGDILGLPAELWDAVANSGRRAVHDAGYKMILEYVSTHTFNPDNIKDQTDLERLKKDFHFTTSEQELLIKKWKQKKPDAILSGVSSAASKAKKEEAIKQIRKMLGIL